MKNDSISIDWFETRNRLGHLDFNLYNFHIRTASDSYFGIDSNTGCPIVINKEENLKRYIKTQSKYSK